MTHIGTDHGQGCQGAAKPVWAQHRDPRAQSLGVHGPSPLPAAGRAGCRYPVAPRLCRAPSSAPAAVAAVRVAQLCPLQLPVCVGPWAGEPRPARTELLGVQGAVTHPGSAFQTEIEKIKGLMNPCWHPANTEHTRNSESQREAMGALTA